MCMSESQLVMILLVTGWKWAQVFLNQSYSIVMEVQLLSGTEVENHSIMNQILSYILLWQASSNKEGSINNYHSVQAAIRCNITRVWESIIVFSKTQLTVFHEISKVNAEKRVENTLHSGVFFMNCKMFGNVGKCFLECLRYLLNRN